MTRIPFAAALTLAFLVAVPGLGASHEAAKGRNGGLRVDAGKYHTEIVADGTATVSVFLSDADDKPISATGFKATAILVIAGKSVRFGLEPTDGSRLVGTAPLPIKAGVKGVVRLTTPDGSTAQGKF